MKLNPHASPAGGEAALARAALAEPCHWSEGCNNNVGVTAGKASHNTSNARCVTAGKMGCNSSYSRKLMSNLALEVC